MVDQSSPLRPSPPGLKKNASSLKNQNRTIIFAGVGFAISALCMYQILQLKSTISTLERNLHSMEGLIQDIQMERKKRTIPECKDGLPGSPGEPGFPGSRGQAGPPGHSGEAGRNGAPGPSGALGEKGAKGAGGRDGMDCQLSVARSPLGPIGPLISRTGCKSVAKNEPTVKSQEIFTHYGRDTCPGSCSLVHKGLLVGEAVGGESELFCLVRQPVETRRFIGKKGKLWEKAVYSDMNPKTLFTTGETVLGGVVPCAICEITASSQMMLAGVAKCPSNYEVMYSGYLMTGHGGSSSSVCMNKDPLYSDKGVKKIDKPQGPQLIAVSLAGCGNDGQFCDELPHGSPLTCVVCMKLS